MAGYASATDVAFFILWLALLLVPVFQEMSLGALTLKQTIEKAKDEVKSELGSIRTELRNVVDVRPTISPSFNFPQPPPDTQLPDIEKQIKEAIAEALGGVPNLPQFNPTTQSVPDEARFFFEIRYSLERELNRLVREHDFTDAERKPAGGFRLGRLLAQNGVITRELEIAIREVYAVASAGMHGQEVSRAKLEFVREVGSSLVSALREL